MIKALFFDIDGTLVSFRTHRLQESTIAALATARRKGIKLFIASGRQFQAIDNLGDEQFDGYITLNGSYCINSKGEVIHKCAIPEEDILRLLRYLQEKPFPCSFAGADFVKMNYHNDVTDLLFAQLNFKRPPIRPMEEINGATVYQLIAFFTKEQEPEIMKVIPHCEAQRWSPYFADVVVKGSNKAVGMQKILDFYNIRMSECMAFGDGGNDTPMLQAAGIGVAMGNANEDVKEQADYVTTSVDEDGVSNALKHFSII